MSVHKNTVNTLFRNYLISKGFKAQNFIGVKFLHNHPCDIDFEIIYNNKNYYVEGEWNDSIFEGGD
ncbi:MAG: hypothetical protein ACTSPQ_20465 [Candidatus Helarchaeota archaeon]